MVDVKEKLLKIHAEASNKPQALEDIHGVIDTAIYNSTANPLVPAKYRSKFGRLGEIQALVDQVDPAELKQIKAALPQLPPYKGRGRHLQKTKKSVRKTRQTRKSRKYSRRR